MVRIIFLWAAVALAFPASGQVIPLPFGFEIIVRNAASREFAVLPGVGVAPGEQLAIEWSVGWFWQTALDPARSTILLTAGDASPVVLPLLSSDQNGFIVQVPPGTPAGPATLQLIVDYVPQEPVPVTVRPSSFGLFTRWGSGTGPALAHNIHPAGPVQNTLIAPAAPGQFVTLLGTGLGTASSLRVILDGQLIEPSSFGPAPGRPGVDQVTFRIPDTGIRPLCYAPVSVQGGDWNSNTASLSIAPPGGTCLHPLGLPPETLSYLEAGGSILDGRGSLSSTGMPEYPFLDLPWQSGFVDLRYSSQQSIDESSAPLQIAWTPGCSRFDTIGLSMSVSWPGEVDAGPELELSGPEGTERMTGQYGSYITDVISFLLRGVAPSPYPAGRWTLTAPGRPGHRTVQCRLHASAHGELERSRAHARSARS